MKTQREKNIQIEFIVEDVQNIPFCLDDYSSKVDDPLTTVTFQLNGALLRIAPKFLFRK